MRPIKFRAQRNDTKEWVTFTLGDLVCGGANSGLFSASADFEWHHWGEFTGLLDKNGKEIYEGDLIRITGDDYSGEPLSAIQSIEFHEDGGYYVDVDDFDDETGITTLGNLKMIGLDCEVIGNIHENGDLLVPTARGIK